MIFLNRRQDWTITHICEVIGGKNMGFWIFMLFCELLIPIIMISTGKYFKNGGPQKINHVFGYRTTMSMKNEDTWNFAHNYCGKIWWCFGWSLLVLTGIVMPFCFGKSEDIVGGTGGVLSIVQLIFLISSIFPTEVALKKTFDKNGIRRK